jgi:hypothetical protein
MQKGYLLLKIFIGVLLCASTLVTWAAFWFVHKASPGAPQCTHYDYVITDNSYLSRQLSRYIFEQNASARILSHVNLKDFGSCSRHLRCAHTVFHIAAAEGIDANIMKACQRNRVSNLVYVAPLGQSIQNAELFEKNQNDTRVRIVALASVYGPGMYRETDIIPSLIHRALTCRSETSATPDLQLPFVYVDDAILAIFDETAKQTQTTIAIAACGRLIQALSKQVVGPCDRDEETKVEQLNSIFSQRLVHTFLDIVHAMLLNGKISLPKNTQHLSAQHLLNTITQRPVLVVLIGQARGGSLAWSSLKTNVLDPLNADLATFFTPDIPAPELQAMATYAWNLKETDDWGSYFDDMVATTCPSVAWRAHLCPIRGIMLGGVAQCGDNAGSGGIQLAFRWALHQKLSRLGLWNEYQHFILSRSDHIYLCPHPPISLAANEIGVPEGEGYGGITDRFLVAGADAFKRSLNIAGDLVYKSSYYADKLLTPKQPVNSEILLATFLLEQGLHVRLFPRFMFAIKMPQDPTSWSTGSDLPFQAPFKLKYPYELTLSERTCKTTLAGSTSVQRL